MCISSQGNPNINMEVHIQQAGKNGTTSNGKMQVRGLLEEPSPHGNALKAQGNVCKSSCTKVPREM